MINITAPDFCHLGVLMDFNGAVPPYAWDGLLLVGTRAKFMGEGSHPRPSMLLIYVAL